MEPDNKKPLEVLIAGAGPAGLMMACQLVLHQISFRIIDQKTSLPPYSGALILHARTMEILQQMGLAEKALKAGIVAQTINMRFNHKKNFSLDISEFGKGLSRFPFLLMIGQGQTERLLNHFLSDHGHWVERGVSLKGFKQKKRMVITEISKPDGSDETIRSGYLIGADGNDSLVRKLLEIPFPGKTQSSRLFITDCQARLPLSTREIFFSFASDITSGFFPLKGNYWRVDGLIPDIQQEEAGFEMVKNYFGRKIRSGIELFHPQWFSVFRSHSKCADQFRNKRCFLIGDAAHVHSPVGAQGMNTGMQDAYNLAWKMGLVIHGKANENLLDTYELERRPLALKIIRNTDIAYSLMTTQSLPARLFRLQLLPLLLPLLLSWLNRNQVMRNRIFNAVSGIGISYEKSILSALSLKDDFPDHSPRPGDRLPSLTYMKRGKRISLYHGLPPTGFYLFVFGKQLLPAPFQQILFKYKGIVSLKYIDNDSATRLIFDTFGIKDEGCYLVRPDLYIAWRCHGFDEEGLNEYLKRALK